MRVVLFGFLYFVIFIAERVVIKDNHHTEKQPGVLTGILAPASLRATGPRALTRLGITLQGPDLPERLSGVHHFYRSDVLLEQNGLAVHSLLLYH